MKRVIVTGANGSGKSYVAGRLASARPDLPLVSYDAIRLTKNWAKRPQIEIDTALSKIIETEAWIIEGGPSLLSQALKRADGVIWLDPPEIVRAWRLAIRPWRNLGKTRPELPSGNIDWPLEQYRFALRSLKNRDKFRAFIETRLSLQNGVCLWHCSRWSDVEKAIQALGNTPDQGAR
ncbi:DNA topology modulation protein FlaR [Consotaella aegiceratis]|uniref:DNA topology modulation protein FlaR n=1 Tax=Consotaella aegiceratis TaxID=3097961 RepID=UPI002F3EE738